MKNFNGLKNQVSTVSKAGSGFTLIELLVVISIIGILIAISLFGIQGARTTSRDTKRKADLEQIANSVELFKNDCGYYPQAVPNFNTALTGATCFNSVNANVYLAVYPTDPISSQSYVYQGQPAGCTTAGPTHCTGYKIWTTLENPGSLPSQCTAPIPNCPNSACNFCLVNP